MKRRLSLAMVGVAAVAVLILATPLAVAVHHMYQTDQIVQLQRQATLAALQIPSDFARSADPVDLPPPKPGSDLALYGTDGRLVVGNGPATADSIVQAALRGKAADGSEQGRTVVAVPVASAENVIAVTRASAPQSVTTRQTERAWAAIAALAAVAVVCAALLARLLAAQITGPLRSVAAAAHDLGRGDFTIKIPHSGVEEVDTVSDALNDTAARLGQAIERERSFSADASHQLRTPIAALRLTLERGVEDPTGDAAAALSDSLAHLDRLETTVENFLALRRDLAASHHSADIAALEDWMRHEWHPRLATAGRPMRIDTEENLPFVRASFEAARHIIDVLIDNAFKHGRGAVKVEIKRHYGTVVVNVSDDGPGIQTPDGLFQRRPSRGPGHGIGLALARSLAEADGGRLVLTDAGPKPVFTVVWPIADVDPAAPTSAAR